LKNTPKNVNLINREPTTITSDICKCQKAHVLVENTTPPPKPSLPQCPTFVQPINKAFLNETKSTYAYEAESQKKT
jgi:hypothetical protein